MPLGPIKFDLGPQRDDFAVNSDAHVALLLQVTQQVTMLTFLVPHHRRKDRVLRSFFQLQDAADNLIARLRRNRLIALRAVALTDPREKDSQEIVDLGDGAYGRSRIVPGRLLGNRDRWAKTRNQIDIRLGHLPQKLPRVAG